MRQEKRGTSAAHCFLKKDYDVMMQDNSKLVLGGGYCVGCGVCVAAAVRHRIRAIHAVHFQNSAAFNGRLGHYFCSFSPVAAD